MRKALLASIGLVAGSIILWSGSTTASATAGLQVSNANILRAANNVSTVNYRRHRHDWCCAPGYYPEYYYAPRAYGYYPPPVVYYPPPAVYYVPPLQRYYAPPVVYEPYDDAYIARRYRGGYYVDW